MPETTPPRVPGLSGRQTRTLRVALIVVVIIGVLWRVIRYFLSMPLWGDEAAVGLNLLDRSFAGLLAPLDYAQVGPPLFLWMEKAALLTLGTSEYALRLLPVLAGLAALGVFYRLGREVLNPLAASLATGILAVSYYPVRHCVELKPYAFDLLAAVLILLPAAMFIRRRESRAMMVWALVVPVSVLISFPAVFVFGAAAAVLFFQLRFAPRVVQACWLAGSLAGVLAFLGVSLIIANPQFHAQEVPMTAYWKDSFPPAAWWRLPFWLLEKHSGNLSAYPLGGKNWGSAGTLLFSIVGVWACLRTWPRSLLALFLLPFGLTLLAAALHRYPYGGSARIAQHLAPAICLFAGAGAGVLIERLRNGEARHRATLLAFGLLAVVGIGGIIRDIRLPSKTPGDARARQLVREWAAPRGSGEIFVVWETCRDLAWNFQWYLRTCKRDIVWNAGTDRAWTGRRLPVSILGFDKNAVLETAALTALPGYRVTEQHTEAVLVGPPEAGPDRWQSLRMEPANP